MMKRISHMASWFILLSCSMAALAEPLNFMGVIDTIKITPEKREVVVEGAKYRIGKYVPVTEGQRPVSILSLKPGMTIIFDFKPVKESYEITKIEVFRE